MGLVKETLGPMSSAFCVMNESGEFVYTETRTTGEGSVLEAEVIIMRMGLKFRRNS